MANRDQHLTTEQLSAFLDRQLSPREQAEYNAHIESCLSCQGALASLRQTVVLLRAMQQPSVPRSFTLPAGVTYLQEPAVHQGEPIRTLPQRRWPYYMRRSLRAMSTIAAVIGFIFLLSGVLPMLIHGGGTTTTSAGSTMAPASHNKAMQPNATATIEAATHKPNNTSTSNASSPTSTPAQDRTPAAKTEPKKTLSNNQPPKQAPPVAPIIDLSVPLVRQALGFALLIIGVVGFLLTRRWSSRGT